MKIQKKKKMIKRKNKERNVGNKVGELYLAVGSFFTFLGPWIHFDY